MLNIYTLSIQYVKQYDITSTLMLNSMALFIQYVKQKLLDYLLWGFFF